MRQQVKAPMPPDEPWAIRILTKHYSQKRMSLFCYNTLRPQQRTHEAESSMQLSIAVQSTRMPPRLSENKEICTTPLAKVNHQESTLFCSRRLDRQKISLLSLKEMYLNTLSLFSYDWADRKKTLAARAKALTQRAAGAATKHFSLREWAFFWRRERK